jgi:hypothetical protein
MCIVTGPNMDFATKLIRRLKNIFKRKLESTFTDKETVLHLNHLGVKHIDEGLRIRFVFLCNNRQWFWKKLC